MGTMPNREKKVVQKLKNDRLRKIRYELRTLLRLENEKRINDLHNKFAILSNNKSLTYEERKKKYRLIIKEQEDLRISYGSYPLCCGICGDRMANLIYNPIMYQWRCVPCYGQAHKNFPKHYP
jgi:hypothetical protein